MCILVMFRKWTFSSLNMLQVIYHCMRMKVIQSKICPEKIDVFYLRFLLSACLEFNPFYHKICRCRPIKCIDLMGNEV